MQPRMLLTVARAPQEFYAGFPVGRYFIQERLFPANRDAAAIVKDNLAVSLPNSRDLTERPAVPESR